MNPSRSIFVFGVLFAVAIAIRSTAASLPSCDSRLRFLLPRWFTHCGCRYSDWSEWEPVPNTIGEDMSGTCESGQAFNETRRQMSIGDGCEERAESRTICAPTQMERLILLLGLGTKSTPEPPVFERISNATAPYYRKKRSSHLCHENRKLCKDFNSQGKRSTQADMEMKNSFHLESNEIKHRAPIPFSVSEHGHRFRRQNNKCDPIDNQHVLFVLDTSGSIPEEEFHKMTRAVADLTTLFCKEIEVAVLTFDHRIYLEFCFKCYGTSVWERRNATQAILDIPYRGGGTATGGAAECVCANLLNPNCGVETAPTANTCIDVIFITDGNSNDPRREICKTVKCLHDDEMLKLNTYSLGIGNYNTTSAREELKCIQGSSNEQSLFWFETFQEFSDAILGVKIGLLLSNPQQTCTHTDGTLGAE